MKYYESIKKAAKSSDKLVRDYLPASGHNTTPALYLGLKKSRSNMLRKALHPFEFFGCKVEIKITPSKGEAFYL
jgi:hypothetical protein